MNQEVANLLGHKQENPPKEILEIGCGYGATMLQLLELLPTSTITGVNLSAEQLTIAEQKIAASRHAQRAHLQQANFQAIPFQADSFDAAYTLESACYGDGETKAKFISEAARLLQPGGKLVVIDGFKKHSHSLPGWIDRIQRRCLTAWEMTSLANIDGFTAELKSQGFTKVAVKDISWNILPTLIFIPIVVLKLLAAQLVQKEETRRQYIQALLLTLLLSPFKRHFGYFVVTCTKSNVELEN
ncbi:MAG: class I SAM-dependent methyltransferase [Saprospiraceae bacterium]|nr:class I SAM-dependent methyltransferase [Saprospiraceae bacterium]MCF8252857.1 class I SAM-dependent methyltransferase [Saprospiraceae bacterium]MCF8283312.1 class I SAM-dependent methyltransferase [Bacteroidales bacterium]MCF8314409.1 class I SAM-dependent methyltransferase [Saprospiraceae bacterium]MCF8443299.1 class I SAM-dependent methyltransferase [Saprospiraceae bacterium]